MATVLVTGATTESVTIEEAIRQLRLGADSGEEAVVKDMVKDARRQVERDTGRSLASQTWRLSLDMFPDTLTLQKGPVTSITSIQYYDTDDAQQSLNVATDIITDFDSHPARITPLVDASWPDTGTRANAVQVTYVAGFTATNIPGNLKRAILFLTGFFYDNRGDRQAVIPEAYYNLIAADRYDMVL